MTIKKLTLFIYISCLLVSTQCFSINNPPSKINESKKYLIEEKIGLLDRALSEEKNKNTHQNNSYDSRSDQINKNTKSHSSPQKIEKPPIPKKEIEKTSERLSKNEMETKPSFLSKENIKKPRDTEEINIDDILEQNYKINNISNNLINQSFDEKNSHLPPVYFESYYTELAFNAVKNENLNILRTFLEEYHFLDKKDEDGNNLLIHAANHSKHNAARILIANNIDINATNDYEMTALHVAAIKGDFQMAKILISSGANFTLKDVNKKTALDYAEQNSYNDIVELFRNYFLSLSFHAKKK